MERRRERERERGGGEGRGADVGAVRAKLEALAKEQMEVMTLAPRTLDLVLQAPAKE